MKKALLSDLTPDPRNANKGTDRGRALLRRSLADLKAGRSILVDKNGVVIAGNKTRQAALDLGMDGAIVVESDGSQLVVVKRTDLDLESDAAAQTLAIADNRIAELSLDWDVAALSELQADGVDLSGLWDEAELGDLLEQAADELLEGGIPGEDDTGIPYESRYAVAVECEDEAQQERVYNALLAQGYKCKVLTL